MTTCEQSFGYARPPVLLSAVLLLGACSGNYSGGPAVAGNGNGGAPATPSSSVQEFFGKSAQTNLGFCRSCHVPGGVADTDTGKLFMLSSDSSQDYTNLLSSWTALGKGVDNNKILTNPSDPAQHHSGGQPWPVGGQPYSAMKLVLSCWDNPANCAALLGGTAIPPVTQLPLLETDPTASWSSAEAFCEGQSQPDNAQLPEDPRHLVVPGIGDGKAVMFNAYWNDCHRNVPVKRSTTCGQYRDRKRRGLVQATQAPADGLFGEASILLQFSRTGWDDLWKVWGLPGRPADFDERLIQRYGLARANFRNPYPLPGEDPNRANGGSGQLPMGLVQKTDGQGRYTGKIGWTCATCHSASMGQPADGTEFGGVMGVSPHNVDFGVLTSDFLSSLVSNGGVPSALLPFPLDVSTRRGALDAAGFSKLALAIVDLDTMRLGSPVPRFNLLAPTTGNTKTANWWNTSHRMRSFYDGSHGIDDHRMNSAAFGGVSQALGPLLGVNFNLIGNDEKYVESVTDFMSSLRPLKYPRPVNTSLAEAGAILFHTKDLWANGALSNIAKPKSNGSCAGCHGVYSPRYANDTAYLADPRLKGVTGYLAPLDIIGTDPARAANFSADVRYGLTSSWIGYPEAVPGWIDPKNKNPVQEGLDDYPPLGMSARPQGVCTWYQEIGYNAPNLYGVWAVAPYLHNGSVPDLWTLLKPEERPPLWRRQLVATNSEERGFDTSLDAYDFTRLGWKYDVMNCTPERCAQPDLSSLPTSGLGITLPTQLLVGSRSTVEERKIYNSHMFASGNQGHDFGKALTDTERRAIIEYLKTL